MNAAAVGAAARPEILVFDVNETLIDIEALGPIFADLFGDRGVLREWFNQLVLYSMSITLSRLYEDYFALGEAVLGMLAEIRGFELGAAQRAALREGMMNLPAHPDCVPALEQLQADGFRLVTLTNSPRVPGRMSPLERAGLGTYFERRFSISSTRAFKPAPAVYDMVAQELNVPASSCCMVASHAWDTVGAQSTGFTGALITRPGNAPLRLPGLPQPHLIAADLLALRRHIAEAWPA